MPKLTADAPQEEKDSRMKDEMEKWKSGTLKSSSGQPVTGKNGFKQAVAISLSEAGESRNQKGPRRGPRKVIKAKR